MGWNDDLNKINSSLMDFFFPRKCPFCGKTTGKQLLCDTCRDTLPRCERVRYGADFGRCAASLYYEGAVPVYGVAVGQGLTCREVDGEKVVDQSNFRAVFTATRLSFWQDATEVAYVSNNRLYITSITVLGGIGIGQWSIGTAEDGLVFRWIGE